MIWAFEIKEPINPTTGKTIPLDPDDYASGLLHAPKPFKVIFKPRSENHIAVIKREYGKSLKDLAPFE